jgi:DNA primase
MAKQAILKADAVVITEGYMDCLMPYQSGFENVVAALGTALTVEQIRMIRRYTKNVIFLFDMDPAGEAAMMRSFDALVEEGMHVKIAELSIGSDPDSFIREHGMEAFRERIARATDLFDYKLKRLLTQQDGFSVNGAAKISQQMLETISRYTSAVERSVYLRKLASALSLPEEALVTELNKLMRNVPGRQPRKVVPTSVSVSAKIRHVEKNILRLLLTEESFILSTKEEIAESDFQDAKVRGVISKIYHWFDQGKKLEHSTFISSFEDPQTRSMITELMADDQVICKDKLRVHQDCIQRIKQDRLKQTRRDLLKQIQEAEANGAHERLNELKQQFNNLMKH